MVVSRGRERRERGSAEGNVELAPIGALIKRAYVNTLSV